MKRLFLITLVALLLAGIGVVVWTVAGLPPVRMVLRHGFSYGNEPTGRSLTVDGVEFVEISPGCFRMGSDNDADAGDALGNLCARLGLPWGDLPGDEMPVHWVEFSRGFWIARTEVTNAQYEAFNPKHERSKYSLGGDDPVVNVSWEDAMKYCAWLSEKSGLAVRLPSESEWECACRAGSERDFCFGDDYRRIGEYAWCGANSNGKAHAVGTRRANAWGLYDFHGNVLEWCEDRYHGSYVGAPTDGTAWTEGSLPGRIRRGGSWASVLGPWCSASRSWLYPDGRDRSLGFRLGFANSQD